MYMYIYFPTSELAFFFFFLTQSYVIHLSTTLLRFLLYSHYFLSLYLQFFLHTLFLLWTFLPHTCTCVSSPSLYVLYCRYLTPRSDRTKVCKFSIFLSSIVSRLSLQLAQSPIQWKTKAPFTVVKLPCRETDHSFPSSTELKNEWGYTSIPPYAFTA